MKLLLFDLSSLSLVYFALNILMQNILTIRNTTKYY